MAKQSGAFWQEDYFNNVLGINNTDTPFSIALGHAEDARNADLLGTGGVTKRLGNEKENSSPNAQLKTLGLHERITKDNSQQIIRSAGTKIQKYASTNATFTDLTEDTSSAGDDFLSSGSTQQVAEAMFSNSSSDVLWLFGGGMTLPYGVYSASKTTKNGTPTPAGSISTGVAGSGGSFASTGTYHYAIAVRKASTQAISNCDLDKSAVVSSTTDEVTVTLSSATVDGAAIDTTKYDKWVIYRSAVNGGADFTTGDLVAYVDSSDTSYVDTGGSTSSTVNIPRAGNTVLDNSTLDTSNTYNVCTVFKNRLVTASNNKVYISDSNKPESWPTINELTIPSGGPVTALGVVSFNTPTTSETDEFLVIFQRSKCWIVTGTGTVTNSIADWTLKFLDEVGCVAQNSVVSNRGYLYWLSYTGFHTWTGSGKPIYISRPLEKGFKFGGEYTTSKFNIAWARRLRKKDQIIWWASHDIYGEQKYAFKLDTRLTQLKLGQDLEERIIDGVFSVDTESTARYGGLTLESTSGVETFYTGDDAGYVWKMYETQNDDSSGIEFELVTPPLDQGLPGIMKTYHKVVAWVENIGNWNLSLDYWSDYKVKTADASTKTEAIGASLDGDVALWDVAEWDTAKWDDYTSTVTPLVFNIGDTDGNMHGDAIKLRFYNENADEPLEIKGFSIIFTPVGEAKIN